MKFLFLLVIIINFFYSSFGNSNEIYVVSKVNNQIITNTDIKKELLHCINMGIKNPEELLNKSASYSFLN